ncbi:unnamed protein product [Diamesa tonsa]
MRMVQSVSHMNYRKVLGAYSRNPGLSVRDITRKYGISTTHVQFLKKRLQLRNLSKARAIAVHMDRLNGDTTELDTLSQKRDMFKKHPTWKLDGKITDFNKEPLYRTYSELIHLANEETVKVSS